MKKSALVVVITKNIMENPSPHLEACKKIEELNTQATINNKTESLIPMYAIVKKDTDIGPFEQFSWRKLIFFETSDDFDKALKEIEEDVKWLKELLLSEKKQ